MRTNSVHVDGCSPKLSPTEPRKHTDNGCDICAENWREAEPYDRINSGHRTKERTLVYLSRRLHCYYTALPVNIAVPNVYLYLMASFFSRYNLIYACMCARVSSRRPVLHNAAAGEENTKRGDPCFCV